VLQVESLNEWQWHLPVACYEENLSVIEAYNDPDLQPVVVMKKLTETQYVSIVQFDSENERFELGLQKLTIN